MDGIADMITSLYIVDLVDFDTRVGEAVCQSAIRFVVHHEHHSMRFEGTASCSEKTPMSTSFGLISRRSWPPIKSKSPDISRFRRIRKIKGMFGMTMRYAGSRKAGSRGVPRAENCRICVSRAVSSQGACRRAGALG